MQEQDIQTLEKTNRQPINFLEKAVDSPVGEKPSTIFAIHREEKQEGFDAPQLTVEEEKSVEQKEVRLDREQVEHDLMKYGVNISDSKISKCVFIFYCHYQSIVYQKDPECNYYEETCKLYIANVVMMTQLKEVIAEKNELKARLLKCHLRDNHRQQQYKFEDNIEYNLSGGKEQMAPVKVKKEANSSQNDGNFDYVPPKITRSYRQRCRRHRRQANEIERFYNCPHDRCEKQYGSEGSLTQHVKLKHPSLYQIILNSQNPKDILLKTSNRVKIQQQLMGQNQEIDQYRKSEWNHAEGKPTTYNQEQLQQVQQYQQQKYQNPQQNFEKYPGQAQQQKQQQQLKHSQFISKEQEEYLNQSQEPIQVEQQQSFHQGQQFKGGEGEVQLTEQQNQYMIAVQNMKEQEKHLRTSQDQVQIQSPTQIQIVPIEVEDDLVQFNGPQ